MSSITIQISDALMRGLRECAAKEGVTVEQLLASAAAEKLSAMITVAELRQRARRAKRKDFEAFLAASPDVPPMSGDELPKGYKKPAPTVREKRAKYGK